LNFNVGWLGIAAFLFPLAEAERNELCFDVFDFCLVRKIKTLPYGLFNGALEN
jgi:hypothetical protein